MKQLYAEPTLIIQQQPDRQLPRRFADGWLTGGWILVGLRPEDQEEIVEDLLAGPESPAYEAAWAEAAEREVIGPDKVVYRLRHEGGLWLIPPGWEFVAEEGGFKCGTETDGAKG